MSRRHFVPNNITVTGTSTGFGIELAKYCLTKGDNVVAIAGDSSKLDFGKLPRDKLLPLDCDVTDEK